jgi:hypothetical protein
MSGAARKMAAASFADKRLNQRGMDVHATYRVTPEAVARGVFAAWRWARDPKTFGRNSAHLPIEEKASGRWLQRYQRLNEVADELADTQLVSLADREVDIYELFAAAPGSSDEVLVRAQPDRVLCDQGARREHHKLREQVNNAPALNTVTGAPTGNLRRAGYDAVDVLVECGLDASTRLFTPNDLHVVRDLRGGPEFAHRAVRCDQYCACDWPARKVLPQSVGRFS